MKPSLFLVPALALLALTGCSSSASEGDTDEGAVEQRSGAAEGAMCANGVFGTPNVACATGLECVYPGNSTAPVGPPGASSARTGTCQKPGDAVETITPIAKTDPRAELGRIASVETLPGAGACGKARVILIGPPAEVPGEGSEVAVVHEGKPYIAGFHYAPVLSCTDGDTLALADAPSFKFSQPGDPCATSLCALLPGLEKSSFAKITEERYIRVTDTSLDHIYANDEDYTDGRGAESLYSIPKKDLGAISKVEPTASGVRITGANGKLEITIADGKATVKRATAAR